MKQPRPPKPHIVRQKNREFSKLLYSYLTRKQTNSFNKTGRGTEAYYLKAIARYEAYMKKWGHLLDVRLSTQPEYSFQR